MEKNSSTLNFNTMPKAFILSLAIIIAFEFFLSRIPEYKLLTPPYEQAALALKGELVDTPSSFDIIVLGDCTGWAAIKPVELEKHLEKTIYNLGVNGAQTYLMSYVLLKRYMAKCREKPELVILQVSASALFYMWGMKSEALNYYILPWFRMDEDFLQELPDTLRSTCYRYKMLKFLPSLRTQFFLRKGFWPAHVMRSNKAEYERYVQYYREQKGFYNEDLDPNKKPVAKVINLKGHFKQFSISDLNVTYMKKILDMLQGHNIKVVICLTPIRDDEMQLWEQYNLRARLNNKIRELFCNYSNVAAFWDMQSVASDPLYFKDYDHVGEKGAIIYSAELARRIQALALWPTDALPNN